jgi:CelD/BcsL family acetyltransferase involved in cellulose biosynthesis
VLNPRVEAMLEDAAEELVRDERVRVWTIAVDNEVISSQIFIAAGGEVAYWLGGFDDAWSKLGPSIQTVLRALEHAWSVGDSRLDLGAGAQEYKYSFADGQDVLEWVTIAPRAPRYPLTRLQLMPKHARERFALRLNPETRKRLRKALSRR